MVHGSGREPGATVEGLGALGQHLKDQRRLLEHHLGAQVARITGDEHVGG